MRDVCIIIPTFNNMDYLLPCLDSIGRNTVHGYRIIIINNGSRELENYLKCDGVSPVFTGKNLGWMGGINEGLKHVPEDCKYVILMNDDTHITPHDYDWIEKLQSIMDKDETVGAVGPCSNVVAGWQNMRHRGLPAFLEVKFLIGFCVMMRKDLLLELGGLDESLPGGDDIDWSIKIRDKGYKLINRRDCFIFHHGFITGNRVHGGPDQVKGWNSTEMTDETNMAIIKRHGFKKFVETVRNSCSNYDFSKEEYGEDSCLMSIVKGKGLDVGCGNNKITPETIGVDLVAKGDLTTFGDGEKAPSVADIKASGDKLPFNNESQDYIVARHNIEHYADVVKALREWNRVLKPGGKLGITTPDDGKVSGIRLDKTHKHSFSRESLCTLVEMCGFKVTKVNGTANQWSFYIIAEKVPREKHFTPPRYDDVYYEGMAILDKECR